MEKIKKNELLNVIPTPLKSSQFTTLATFPSASEKTNDDAAVSTGIGATHPKHLMLTDLPLRMDDMFCKENLSESKFVSFQKCIPEQKNLLNELHSEHYIE
ncbi:unnamed protein product, partial [Lymnaea stagnalis]